MSPKRLSLEHEEDRNETPPPKTLEEQLRRYQLHWSAVDFDRDDPAQLLVRYGRRGPKGWWPLIPAALCLLGAAAVFFVSPLDGSLNALIAGVLVVVAVAFVLLWRSCVRVRLSPKGLVAAAFPPLTGPSARVPLKQIRRFRVEKSGDKGARRFALHCLTRDDRELPLITNIPIKDDAYLTSMLLIERVKSLRS